MAAAHRMPRCKPARHLLQVVWMHAFSPAVSKLLFHAASRKLQPRLVKERAKLVHAGHPDQDGRSIRDDSGNATRFRPARSLQLRAPRSLSPETTAESPKRLEISESKARFVQAFRRRMAHGRGMHSKSPGSRQSKWQCLLPKCRIVPLPKARNGRGRKRRARSAPDLNS